MPSPELRGGCSSSDDTVIQAIGSPTDLHKSFGKHHMQGRMTDDRELSCPSRTTDCLAAPVRNTLSAAGNMASCPLSNRYRATNRANPNDNRKAIMRIRLLSKDLATRLIGPNGARRIRVNCID